MKYDQIHFSKKCQLLLMIIKPVNYADIKISHNLKNVYITWNNCCKCAWKWYIHWPDEEWLKIFTDISSKLRTRDWIRSSLWALLSLHSITITFHELWWVTISNTLRPTSNPKYVIDKVEYDCNTLRLHISNRCPNKVQQ